jgi:hypothetical protein
MEELIEIIIRLIAGMMQGGPKKATPPPMPRQRVEPSNRAVMTAQLPTARRGPARKPGKRSTPPPMVAVAQPIMTGGAQIVATASTGMVHAVPAKSIAATAAAAAPNQKPSATAETLRRWMTPATLRQQFIVTEIFQPPLALRAGSDRH